MSTLISSLLGAYLLGAVPTGFLLTRVKLGKDIREHGSGNIGATNVLRTAGKVPALITLIIDILKGFCAVAIIAGLSYSNVDYLDYNFWRAALGFAAICGHVWPVFLKFKGGKGVATTIGVLAAVAWLPLSLALIIWLAAFYFTSYVSVGSLLFGVSLPVFAAVCGAPFYTILLSIAICVLNTYRHKDNIERLLKGEERKTILFKKNPVNQK